MKRNFQTYTEASRGSSEQVKLPWGGAGWQSARSSDTPPLVWHLETWRRAWDWRATHGDTADRWIDILIDRENISVIAPKKKKERKCHQQGLWPLNRHSAEDFLNVCLCSNSLLKIHLAVPIQTLRPVHFIYYKDQHFSKIPNKIFLLPTMFAISSSMLFSAQAHGRDPTTWPWAPLRVRAKVRKCKWRLVLVYGKVEGGIIITSWPTCPSPPLHRSWPTWAAGPVSCPPYRCSPACHQQGSGQLQVEHTDTQTIFILHSRQYRTFAWVSNNIDSSNALINVRLSVGQQITCANNNYDGWQW